MYTECGKVLVPVTFCLRYQNGKLCNYVEYCEVIVVREMRCCRCCTSSVDCRQPHNQRRTGRFVVLSVVIVLVCRSLFALPNQSYCCVCCSICRLLHVHAVSTAGFRHGEALICRK